MAKITEDDFLKLQKYLRTKNGELLLQILRMNTRLESPRQTSNFDPGFIGTLYGTGLGWQACVDFIDMIQNKDLQATNEHIESTYEDQR